MTSGALLPNAVTPRIRISLAAPGWPEVITVTPEALQGRASGDRKSVV